MKITRWILLFIVILSAPAMATAQYKAFSFGFKAAPGLGWLKTDTKGYTAGSSLSFSWGFVSEFNFSENYCILTGVNFQFLNGHLTYPDQRAVNGATETFVDRKLRVKYFQIPFALKMRTTEMNNMRFFGQFGLGTGFRLNATGKDDYTAQTGGRIIETNNIDGEVSFFRESMILGLGAEYRISSGNTLSVGLTFDNGFTDILPKKNKVDPGLSPKATNSILEVSVALMF